MRISTFVEISVSPYKLRATTFSLCMSTTSLLPLSGPIHYRICTKSDRLLMALCNILHSFFWTGRELCRWPKPPNKKRKILLHTNEYYKSTAVQVFVGTFQSLNFVGKYGRRSYIYLYIFGIWYLICYIKIWICVPNVIVSGDKKGFENLIVWAKYNTIFFENSLPCKHYR